jgi:AmmeMemoRadiSam system protein A
MEQLDGSDRKRLLALARAAVEATAHRGAVPGLDEATATPGLRQFAAAFVTLHSRGRLRGCIGMMRYDIPLWRNVADSAVAAARSDPRFLPVEAAELPGLALEISVLEPPVAIADAAAFEVGRHGIVVERGSRRALLLPQVAAEQGWDAGQMLDAVCRKADLADGAWRDPATSLFVFESICFSDESEGGVAG